MAKEQKEVVGEVQEAPETPKRKKAKVVVKDFKANPGCLTMEIVGVENSKMVFDPKELPENVQAELPAFALGHKLGDATSGKHGQEAYDAVMKVWEAMKKGDWTTRAPAAKKVSLSTVEANLAKLSPEEQEKAKAAMKMLGIMQ